MPVCTFLSSFLTNSQEDGVNRFNVHKDLLVSVSHHTAINSVATDFINHFRFLPLEVTPLFEPPTHFIHQLGSAVPFSLGVLFLFFLLC